MKAGGDRAKAHSLSSLGIAHAEQGALRAAEQAFRRCLKIDPSYAGGHYNLAKTLRRIGRNEESLLEYERAYALDPAAAPIQIGLCGIYRVCGRPERALALMRKLAAGAPLAAAFTADFAECLAEVEGMDAALAWLRAEIARQPDARLASGVLAVMLLALGHWREGWQHYLLRLHAAPGRPRPALPARLDGKRVLLRTEQGPGDVLFFLRFVAELRSRGATVALDCPPKLAPLLAGQIDFGGGADDLQVWVGDLPALLEAQATPPAFALRANPDAREKLAHLGPAPYLGLGWRAGTRSPSLLSKEISPVLLGEAVRGWPGTLLSLQRADAAEPGELEALGAAAGARVHDLSALNDDLAEAAALLERLDEYVTVSNTNIHILAGLRRTARVLVPHPGEWRWMRREGPSPWFPEFPVYRQSKSLDWAPALRRLREELLRSAGSPPPARA